jgi:hypothetical protein
MGSPGGHRSSAASASAVSQVLSPAARMSLSTLRPGHSVLQRSQCSHPDGMPCHVLPLCTVQYMIHRRFPSCGMPGLPLASLFGCKPGVNWAGLGIDADDMGTGHGVDSLPIRRNFLSLRTGFRLLSAPSSADSFRMRRSTGVGRKRTATGATPRGTPTLRPGAENSHKGTHGPRAEVALR